MENGTSLDVTDATLVALGDGMHLGMGSRVVTAGGALNVSSGGLPNLREVSVFNCKVTDAGVEALKKKCPWIRNCRNRPWP